jgi:hypothetical protein
MSRRLLFILALAVAALQLSSGSASATAVRLTPQTASEAFEANILSRNPSAILPASEGLLCPETYEENEGERSICYAEYQSGNTWNLQGAEATSEGGRINFKFGPQARWTRKWVPCKLTRVPGKLISNNNCGSRQPESDAYFVAVEVVANIRFHHPTHSVGWQFTESAGFTSVGIYRGSKQGRSYVFTDAVGDSFKYKP